MQKDIRNTELYREAEALFEMLRQPATGRIVDAAEVHVSPNGRTAVFAGSFTDKLDGVPFTRICEIRLSSGDLRVLTFGPGSDRTPKYSPDGRQVAFVSDRHRRGDAQLYLLDPRDGSARAAVPVDGWVEYLHWSPDGKKILLGVAGRGADIAGVQGAVSSGRLIDQMSSWMPKVETGDESYRWRRVWLYELATNTARQVGRANCNVWEATWCGNESLAAIVSPGPLEGLWYTASLYLFDAETGGSREIYRPSDQIGCPAGSSSGKQATVIEAVCSDRSLVIGNVRLIDLRSGGVTNVDTGGVDVSHVEWRSPTRLLLAGYRGAKAVIGSCDVVSGTFSETWSSQEIGSGWPCMTVAGSGDAGDCVLVGEGFVRSPEIAAIREGEYRPIKSFDMGYAEYARIVKSVESLSWRAPDGVEIQGWLLRPGSDGPHPMVMMAHGGPVLHWAPVWLGRANVRLLLLLKRGYAILLPNPRGSTGRGQPFARLVQGDMGGDDTYDCLSGIDHLVKEGIADAGRLGVMGVSYGGFMTSWLVTQDSRFAAAVSISPVINHVTTHLTSNIPEFVELFLADTYTNAGGKYFQRSPVMQAYKVRTPTLNICGALDRCTPPEEAVQFHRAILENGGKSVLLIYPEEGHGVRKLPAAIDCAARIVSWFERHIGADTTDLPVTGVLDVRR